ncbi:MAG TPA: hypothetical protein VEH27_03865 [Methylomirabilota bacterium]|nr:hypothetical protein [Methylomirabilota bacterium]
MRTIQLCTTKPELNQVEYAVYEDGVLIRHGEVVDFDPANLTPEQTAAVNNARNLLLALATRDAVTKGLIPAAPAA